MNEGKRLLALTIIIYIKISRRFSSIHVKCNFFGIVPNRLNFLIFLIHRLDCFIEEKYLRKTRQYCWFLWYLQRLSEMLSNKLSSIPINTIFKTVIETKVLNTLIFYAPKCCFKHSTLMLSVKCNILFTFQGCSVKISDIKRRFYSIFM